MSDTTVEIDKKFRSMILEKSGTERIIMGADMAEAAKVMALSSMGQEENESKKRIHLFLRFYFNDFSKNEREKIVQHLKKIKKENDK